MSHGAELAVMSGRSCDGRRRCRMIRVAEVRSWSGPAQKSQDQDLLSVLKCEFVRTETGPEQDRSQSPVLVLDRSSALKCSKFL